MDRPNPQARISEFVARLRYENLPQKVISDARYRVLDWLGCALAGSGYKASRIVSAMVQADGGAPQATLLRACIKVPMAQAALANGIMGHAAEYDDGHRMAIGHPGSVTIPTALAVAEHLGRSGRELLAAIVAGYEVFIRLAAAINPSHYRVWHATSTCGTFAAAATAASLLGLDALRTQRCLGIAGTMASGLQESFGTHAKPLNVGHACQSGIQAGLLAMADFTGPEDVLFGSKGFVAATAEQCDRQLIEQIGEGTFLSTTAFYKVYASCGHTNSPLDALFAILRRCEFPAASVKAVRIDTYGTAVQLTGMLKHQTEDEAKFSLPFCVAIALLYKRITLAEFAPDKLRDPAVITLARKVIVSEDVDATAVFPRERRAKVLIEFHDGQQIEDNITHPCDTPDYQALEDKFLSLAEMAIPVRDARLVAESVLNIEQGGKLAPLMAMLRSRQLQASPAML